MAASARCRCRTPWPRNCSVSCSGASCRSTVRNDLHASGTFEAPDKAAGASFAGTPAEGIELDLGGFGLKRTLRIGPTDDAPRDDESQSRWRASDLRLGFPRLPASQAEQWTPQMLSLDRLHAFSVKKGCYPGQEIVARTHFLGQAKRGLTLFEARANPRRRRRTSMSAPCRWARSSARRATAKAGWRSRCCRSSARSAGDDGRRRRRCANARCFARTRALSVDHAVDQRACAQASPPPRRCPLPTESPGTRRPRAA